MDTWLETLPKPAGVFVCFDGWARWVLAACVIEGLQALQEVSVRGVDDHHGPCDRSPPGLRSIDANVDTADYTAAGILNNLMSDQPAPHRASAEQRRAYPDEPDPSPAPPARSKPDGGAAGEAIPGG